MYRFKGMVLSLLLAGLVGCAGSQVATESAMQSEDAVAAILFEYGADGFTTYKVERSGAVEVSFARDTPDEVFNELVDVLRAHPDTGRVRVDRSAPACGLF